MYLFSLSNREMEGKNQSSLLVGLQQHHLSPLSPASSAIPRFGLKQSNLGTNNQVPKCANAAMGDRLSSLSPRIPIRQDGDWITNGDVKQQNDQPVLKYPTNKIISQHQETASAKHQDNNVVAKLTPRLPRGVSKIPHQVNDNVTSKVITKQADSSKYLTFSKDQAASHFKSLREELGAPKVTKTQPHEVNTSLKATQTTTPTSPFYQKKVEDIGIRYANVTPNNRQQPICEAFIMTGQSMLKLSCNESENNNINMTTNNDNHLNKQTDPRIKSLSLNKLNGNNKTNDNKTYSSHLSTEEIVRSPLSTQKEVPQTVSTKERSQDPLVSSENEATSIATIPTEETRPEPTPTLGLGKKVDKENSEANVGLNHQAAASLMTLTTTPSAKEAATTQQPEQLQRADLANVSESCKLDVKHNSCHIKKSRDDLDSLKVHKQSPTNTICEEGIIVANYNNNSVVASKHQSSPTLSAKQLCGGCGDDSGVTSLTEPMQNNLVSTNRNGLQEQQQSDKQMEQINNSPQTPTCTDRDSARRLAKRLYNLSGFKKSDVCHHLAKNNPFSQMVAEEYLKLFDFRSMKLDGALRKFLSKLQLDGETQERERMLYQFSRRYYECNKDKFPSSDTVQTLVCALILLNTDLHGGHNKKKRSKLSLGAFIDGLNSSLTSNQDASQAATYSFPRHLLVDLYESVKKRPFECSRDDNCDMTSFEVELDKIYSQQANSNRCNTLPTRRFAPGSNAPSSTMNASSRRHLKQGLNKLNNSQQDDSEAAIEFKSGYLNRKRVLDANGKRTSKGRRSWRRVHVILQDLRMIMRPGIHDDSAQQKQQDHLIAKQQAKIKAKTIAQDMHNTIKIYHTFAKRSTNYTKRDSVFHLRLADQSEFLIQANNEQDMNSWIDTINFASACLSSPALPNAITNTKLQQQKPHKPVLPLSYTRLSYWEQLIDHEERLQRLKQELDEHLSEASNTKNANKRFKTEFIEKIAYLKMEIERYKVYVDLMRKKSNSPEAIILSKHPQIASLVPSDEMVKLFVPPSEAPTKTIP